jgi:hypothetical protein
MRRVICESPYRADTTEGVAANVSYAKECVRHCLARNEAPICSHLLIAAHGILDDSVPAERGLGINAGLSWQTAADVVVVYTDRGISGGMELAIDRAKFYNVPVEYRSLGITGEAA